MDWGSIKEMRADRGRQTDWFSYKENVALIPKNSHKSCQAISMNHSFKLLATSCLLSATMLAHAQEESASPVAPTEVSDEASADSAQAGEPDFLKRVTPDGVSLGVGMLVSEGILVGESARIYTFPTVGYVGERVFITGISGGVHIFKASGFTFDALMSLRLDGWGPNDLDAEELAAVGINRSLLTPRRNEIDAGLGASYTSSKWGKLSLTAQADVSDASNGYEFELLYQAAFDVWGGALIPSAAVSYWSDNLSDYYYGTRPQEVAAGVPSYLPGSAVIPSVGLTYLHTMPKNWVYFGGLQYQWLSDDILDSPLVDSSASGGQASVFFGVSYSFGKIN